LILPQLPQKMKLTSKVVKIGPKIIVLLPTILIPETHCRIRGWRISNCWPSKAREKMSRRKSAQGEETLCVRVRERLCVWKRERECVYVRERVCV
jgi:hypothetical protein